VLSTSTSKLSIYLIRVSSLVLYLLS